jgi:UDP-N-acetylglucosamine 2-epimerase (non-hydrolysing)
LQAILGKNRYDLVVVQGDTTSALMSAIGSFYNKIPVAHVEAGLRTHDRYSPWPEEMNRVLIAKLAELHFAPTDRNARQLIDEGVSGNAVHVTGNSVIDALMVSIKKIRNVHDESGLKFLPSSGRRLVLITAHRRENYGDPIRSIASAINTLSIRFPDTDFVLPMHRNPNIRESLISILSNKQDNIHLMESLDYPNFIRLMDKSTIILTDSGGIQEEAPSLQKPVLVIRESTERTEAVESGCVKVIGTNAQTIIQEVSLLLTKPSAYGEFISKANPYGDGTASVRISDIMRDFLKSRA